MDFRFLTILSAVGLCLIAFGNQSVVSASKKDRNSGGVNRGSNPLASLAYAFRNPSMCWLGITAMGLGLLLIIAASVCPFFYYRAP